MADVKVMCSEHDGSWAFDVVSSEPYSGLDAYKALYAERDNLNDVYQDAYRHYTYVEEWDPDPDFVQWAYDRSTGLAAKLKAFDEYIDAHFDREWMENFWHDEDYFNAANNL